MAGNAVRAPSAFALLPLVNANPRLARSTLKIAARLRPERGNPVANCAASAAPQKILMMPVTSILAAAAIGGAVLFSSSR